MDNQKPEDIDKLFRDRFAGYKDRSVDPASQWAKFESGLNAVPNASGAYQGMAISGWGVAASIAGIIGLAVFTSNDSQSPLSLESEFVLEQQESADQVLYSNDETFVLNDYSAFSSSSNADEPNAGNEREFVSNDQDRYARDPSMIIQDIGVNPGQGVYFKNREDAMLASMDRIALDVNLSGIESRNRPVYEDLKNTTYTRSRNLYVRGGARIGNGESNTEISKAKWSINGVLSIGYAYALSAKTFVTLEAGYLRRTGNGVERSKNQNLAPLISMIMSTNGLYNSSTNAQSVVNIRESIVATEMRFLHLPALVHVNLNTKSNASIGCFADYLLSARNDSYMVYNGQDYITTNLDLRRLSSKDGLKNMRYGLIAGYEYNVSDRISGDFRAMLPITSIYDRNSDYYAPKEPNQMVDLQFALSYKI